MTIEELIEDCGGLGKFQILVLFGLGCHKLATAWSMLQITVACFIPDWWCEPGPSLTNTSMYDNTTLYDKASLYDNVTLRTCSVTPPGNASQPVQCASYQFEDSPRTIVSEWSLVCDRQWLRGTVMSLQMVGVLIGAVLGGQLSDLIGRKKTLFGATLVHAIFNIVAAFSSSWEMFAGIKVCLGICVGTIQVMNNVYILEFMPIKWRPIETRFPVWAAGVCIMSLCAYLVQDWVYLHIGCAILGLPFLLGGFYFTESVRWLTTQGRLEEAEKVIHKMATVNGRDMPPQTRAVLRDVYTKEKESRQKGKKYSYWDLFKELQIIKTNCILCYLWFVISCSYYGMSFGVSAFTGNLYVNIVLIALVDTPPEIAAFNLMNRFGRKKTISGMLIPGALFTCACIIIQIAVPPDIRGPWIRGLSLAANMVISGAWMTAMVWTAEQYPTVVRSLAFGLTSSANRLGGVAAPFILDLENRLLGAYIIMTAMFAGAVVLVQFLPETMGKPVPESFDTKADIVTGGDTKLVEVSLENHQNKLYLQDDRAEESLVPH